MIDPSTAALLVMDFQPGILGRLADPDGVVARAAEAIDVVRGRGGHIGYVRVAFTDDDLERMPADSAMSAALARAGGAPRADDPATQIDDRLRPQDGDVVVRKTRVGAFSTTDLERQLRERGVTTLVLAGISTSGVVLSTVRDAADRDYRLFVLSDACADPDADVHAFLVERVFPRQAEVVAVDSVGRLIS